jgi:hypothetical protein
MTEKQKSKVKADIKKNRLYITLPSAANTKELQQIYTDVRFCVADLKPGFDVVTDLSQCTIGYLSGIPTLRKIMDFLVVNQMGRVIRIVGGMSVVLKQLIGIASKFQCYKPVYVATHEEAEEELDRPIKRNGLRFEINHRQIEYSIDHEKGTGRIVDISISGCAVQEPTIALSTNEEVSITIPLYQEQDKLSPFTTSAKVIWAEGNKLAFQFLDMDDDRKALLNKCLVNEARIEIA